MHSKKYIDLTNKSPSQIIEALTPEIRTGDYSQLFTWEALINNSINDAYSQKERNKIQKILEETKREAKKGKK